MNTSSMESASEVQLEPQLRASANSMYFGTLPTDISLTIIKYVFLHTNTREDDYVDTPVRRRQRIHSLAMLVSDNTPFHGVLSQLSLTELRFGPITNASYLRVEDGVYVIGSELVEDNGLEPGIPERILQLCGELVRVVRFIIYSRDLPSKETDNDSAIWKFATLVKRYCPNVENLSFEPMLNEDNPLPFEDIFPGFLEQFSSQLRSIEWIVRRRDEGYLRIPDISTCKNIRELVFPPCSRLISFLRTFGASLESLTVSYADFDGYAEMLDVIEDNCKKLSRVSLRDYSRAIETVGEERYANFISSFGSEIIEAQVEELSAGKLAQVVRACPNLFIPYKVYYDNRFDGWERVSLLGPMIKNLTVVTHKFLEDKGAALENCTNLESLFVCGYYAGEEAGIDDGLDLTFLLPLSSSSLIFYGQTEFDAIERNIDILSSAFRNLRHLRLSLANPIENGIDFKSISHSNTQLGSVHIREFDEDDKQREKSLSIAVLRMLVNAFRKCHFIEFILVNDIADRVTRDEIHDICSSLPARDVTATIQVGSTTHKQYG